MNHAMLLRRLPPALQVAATSFERFVRQEMTTYAAALAYRGLLALFPFIIFIIAVINALDIWQIFGALGDWAATAPEGRVPRAIRQWLVLQVRQRSEGTVISVGAVAAVWAVASAARVLRRALNVASGIEERHSGWRRLMTSFLVAPVIAVMVIVIAALFLVTGSTLLELGRWFSIHSVLLVAWDWLRWPAGVLLTALVTVTVYRFFPARGLPWRVLIPGAIATAIVWGVASSILPLAVSSVLQFGVTYGSFSAAIVLLVYLYVTAAGLLLGAELNATLEDQRFERPPPPTVQST